ncbi:MAG TPA: hypothetical protein VJZ27_04510 [Aggregatilineales bacterium]|nr:hypothetical protein [Aggregatilineales bacterium]
MPLNDQIENRFRELLHCILRTHEEEIDAEAWDLQFERVAEMAVNGEDISTVLPAIQQYLENSPDCNEEFRAVVAMLRAEKQSMLPGDNS